MSAPRRPPVVLVVVLLVALASGAAASLLIGAATAHGAAPAPANLVIVPSSILETAIVVACFAVVGFLIYRRLTGSTVSVPNRAVVTALTAILLGILIVAALRTWGGAGPSQSGNVPSTGSGNTTTVPTNVTTNATCSTAVCAGGLIWSPSLPPWLPFVILVALVLIVVAIAIPQLGAYLADRRAGRTARAPAGPTAAAVQEALQRAQRELDLGEDARGVILALYLAVLERLAPMVGSVEVETPEEIRARHLVRLGIRPRAAEALTRLFEEARYSSHPLTGESAERGREAVEEALADLARAPLPP